MWKYPWLFLCVGTSRTVWYSDLVGQWAQLCACFYPFTDPAAHIIHHLSSLSVALFWGERGKYTICLPCRESDSWSPLTVYLHHVQHYFIIQLKNEKILCGHIQHQFMPRSAVFDLDKCKRLSLKLKQLSL